MSHPYKPLPNTNFWSRAVAGRPPFELDPVVATPFRIGPNDKVATSGSCFAQHIARRLSTSGFNYFVPEQPPEGMSLEEAKASNYGVFSARFGNVYTTRQLLQLFDRAYDSKVYPVPAWALRDRFVDPFRPQIQPDGFATIEEMEASRVEHLAAVRRMFEELDVLVFTLGLTESWIHRETGAAVPIAPGVSGGEWNPAHYTFHNLSVAEVIADLNSFIERLRTVNPGAKVLLTVSPVPLVASYVNQHVLVSTVYSKSVLRVAAAEAQQAHKDVFYFPSFEIITATANAHRYYDDDLREVKELGVDHVMRVFFRHMVEGTQSAPPSAPSADFIRREAAEASNVVCDEEAIERAM